MFGHRVEGTGAPLLQVLELRCRSQGSFILVSTASRQHQPRDLVDEADAVTRDAEIQSAFGSSS